MSHAAAQTSIMPMALAAAEQYFPPAQRVLNDALAVRFLPLGARLFTGLLRPPPIRSWIVGLSEKSNPGIWGGLLCRKRYIDEKLAAAGAETAAMVNLGAGFDTRPYRLPCLAGVPVWEVDQRENIEAKEKRLRKIFGAVPQNVKLVAIDFDRESLDGALNAHGYAPGLRTFFVWEAVTQYLTAAGVRQTFDWLQRAAPASRLIFTYVRQDFLDGSNLYGWEAGYKRFVATKIWQFGLAPEACPAFLNDYGWRIIEDAGYDELASRYIAPTGRRLASTPAFFPCSRRPSFCNPRANASARGSSPFAPV